jgi:hypothetical protein
VAGNWPGLTCMNESYPGMADLHCRGHPRLNQCFQTSNIDNNCAGLLEC